MKKILMLAACTAAMTAITSCSSNDEDVLAQEAATPESTVTISDSKCPFNFIVGMDNGTYTRGTGAGAGVEVESDMVVSEDMEVTRASVISSNPFNTDGTGFNLYGFHGSGMMWTGAKPYSRTSGVWGGAGDWPSTSGACYFYALSYAGSNTASGNVTDEPDGD